MPIAYGRDLAFCERTFAIVFIVNLERKAMPSLGVAQVAPAVGAHWLELSSLEEPVLLRTVLRVSIAITEPYNLARPDKVTPRVC
jgi:hypothetical protein